MAAPFECLRRFYGFAVSRFAVSMASPFLWLKPFYASLFEWLTPFSPALFLWLRRLNDFAVSKFYVVVMRKKYINICSSENYVYFCGIVMAITVMLFTKK